MSTTVVRALLAAGLLVGLAGCENLPGQAKTGDANQMIAGTGCNPGQHLCRVKIEVTDCTDRTGSGLVATPDDLKVGERSLIIWFIATPGYKFAPRGIDIKKNDGVFEDPRPLAAGKIYSWHDKHNEYAFYGPSSYNYTINVVHDDPAVRCAVFDPRVSNQ